MAVFPPFPRSNQGKNLLAPTFRASRRGAGGGGGGAFSKTSATRTSSGDLLDAHGNDGVHLCGDGHASPKNGWSTLLLGSKLKGYPGTRKKARERERGMGGKSSLSACTGQHHENANLCRGGSGVIPCKRCGTSTSVHNFLLAGMRPVGWSTDGLIVGCVRRCAGVCVCVPTVLATGVRCPWEK